MLSTPDTTVSIVPTGRNHDGRPTSHSVAG